ncbi:MAG: phosphatidate cytidylyltransferase [Kiritimatiellia bacterium]
MLKNRILSGLLMGALLISAAVWLPPFHLGILLILSALTFAAMMEFYRLLDAAKIGNYKFLGILFGILLLMSTWSRTQADGLPDVSAVIIFLFIVSVFTRQLAVKTTDGGFLPVAGTLLGFFYVAFMLDFMARLLFSWGDVEGRALVIYMIIVVKSTDIGAYFIGCATGRHKLIPHISPAKSWEGCFGGIAVAVAVSVIWQMVSRGNLGVVHFSILQAVIMGLLLSVTGIIGDLMESLFKRAAAVKDSSSVIKGMGGLLDVIDSLLPAAPVLYIFAHTFLK